MIFCMAEVKWVLVAGTGNYELPDSILWTSKAVGARLARHGYGLVVGGWSGVDYVVAEEYAKEIQRKGARVRDSLIQVVPHNSDLPRFRGGHVVYVTAGVLEFTESIKYCNAAILLGGIGGAYGVFQVARQEQKPVFPFPGTGGDARQAYLELLSDWPVPLPRSITEEEFRRLDRKVLSAGDADLVAETVLDLLEIAFAPEDIEIPPRSVFISYSHKDKLWLDRLIDKLRPLQQRGELQVWADPEIVPSDQWLKSIHTAITAADVAILLVSPHSVNSKFIAEEELKLIVERTSTGNLKLLWFVLSRCEYRRFGLDLIQAAYNPSRPLDELSPSEQNEALVSICKQVRRAVGLSRDQSRHVLA